MELFNKGDFAGITLLYTDDATALPPGAAMVKGNAAIGAMWKGLAEQVSDPKVTTLDVKPLGPSAALEIGTFSLKTKGPTPQEITGKYVVVWEKVGEHSETRNRYLERRQVEAPLSHHLVIATNIGVLRWADIPVVRLCPDIALARTDAERLSRE